MKLRWLAIGILSCLATIFAQTGPPPEDEPMDEPGRAVARLAIINGDASICRGDSSEWVAAAVNSPLMSGDSISVAAGGRAEVQLDAAHFIRIAGDTELRLADLENGHYQVQVSHGLISWRVLRDTQAKAEIDTPLVGVHPGLQSTVRVEVNPDGTSHITVRRGEADISTQRGSEKLGENSTMDLRGSVDDPEFQVVAATRRDDFDGWGEQRDSYLLRAQSQRYVTQDVHGVEDLDAYGRWDYDQAYGWVWAPQVAANWAPYQNGQWVWEDYYGWTWVDYAPWGWAPFHYGYWYNRVGFGWSWYPGARGNRVWWRPAMVSFVGWGGGSGSRYGYGNIGWVPLAPRESFHPWYGRGGYAGGPNAIRNANINNYRNAGAARGITAVSAADFERGNFRNRVSVDRGALQQASVVRGAPMAPANQNLRVSNRAATVGGSSPSSQRFYGPSTTTPDSRRTPFSQQQNAARSAINGQVGNQMIAAQRSPTQQPPQSQNWSRFQSTPQSSQRNAARDVRQSNPDVRQANPGGYDRFSSTPNNAPRQIRVAPSIVRQRPDTTSPQYRNEQQYRNDNTRPQSTPSYDREYSRPQTAPAPSPRNNLNDGGYSRPQQSAPPAPVPQRNYGGGGGYSRPQQSAPAPAPQRNYGGGGGYSRPQQSAPAPVPQRNYGGGGGYSRPQQSAPPPQRNYSQPRQSAPAPRNQPNGGQRGNERNNGRR